MLFNVFITNKSSGYIFYIQRFDGTGFGVAGGEHGGWLKVDGSKIVELLNCFIVCC